MDSPIKVMVIDDEFHVRDSYSRLLANDGRAIVIAEAEDQSEALKKLTELATSSHKSPDVIALDLHLPFLTGQPVDYTGGISLISKLKAISPTTRILIITQETQEDPIIEAISAGADGYVWKNETADAFATAIQRLHEGKLVVTISVAEKMLKRFKDLQGRDCSILPRKRRHRGLSELLYQTMKCYCYDGLPAKEIAERERVSVETINSRIKKAKEILGASTRREAFRKMSEIDPDTTG